MRVVVNGAGIAGTAIAYWLSKSGHDVLLVERAPKLRTGGYVLNLWGIGYDAVEKMGLLPKLLSLQYQSDELRMVDRRGRTRGGYPSSVLLRLARGRIASLARADIAPLPNAINSGGRSPLALQARSSMRFSCIPSGALTPDYGFRRSSVTSLLDSGRSPRSATG